MINTNGCSDHKNPLAWDRNFDGIESNCGLFGRRSGNVLVSTNDHPNDGLSKNIESYRNQSNATISSSNQSKSFGFSNSLNKRSALKGSHGNETFLGSQSSSKYKEVSFLLTG